MPHTHSLIYGVCVFVVYVRVCVRRARLAHTDKYSFTIRWSRSSLSLSHSCCRCCCCWKVQEKNNTLWNECKRRTKVIIVCVCCYWMFSAALVSLYFLNFIFIFRPWFSFSLLFFSTCVLVKRRHKNNTHERTHTHTLTQRNERRKGKVVKCVQEKATRNGTEPTEPVYMHAFGDLNGDFDFHSVCFSGIDSQFSSLLGGS